MAPYDNERKAPVVNQDDVKSIVNLVIWAGNSVKLSDGRTIVLKVINEGLVSADISADCLNELDPEMLEKLARKVIERGEGFVASGGVLRVSCKVAD